MTNNTVLLEEKEDEREEKEFLDTVGITLGENIIQIMTIATPPIVVFILFTYLGWFQWNKDTGLRKIIIQFIFSIIIGFIVFYFVAAFLSIINF